MKKKTSKKIKTITIRILEDLLDIAEDLAEISVSRKAAYGYFYQNKNYQWPKTKIGRWLESLKQEGYVTCAKSDHGSSIVLTNKAKIKIVEKIANKIDKDGKNRFISFDIPEEKRKTRNKFRRAIKNIGFAKIQASLWVIDRDVSGLVEMIIKEYGVEKYVAYIVSEKSDIDEYIKKNLLKVKKQNQNLQE